MVSRPCELLERRNTVTLLLVLYKMEDGVKITELMAKVPSYHSLKKCTLELQEAGLVYIDQVTDPRPSLRVGLTDDGREVADLLQMSADIISRLEKKRGDDE